MKVYQCDSCKKVIDNPYDVRMKEFYVAADYDNGVYFPVDSIRKVKIHMCDECYMRLHLIAKIKNNNND